MVKIDKAKSGRLSRFVFSPQLSEQCSKKRKRKDRPTRLTGWTKYAEKRECESERTRRIVGSRRKDWEKGLERHERYKKKPQVTVDCRKPDVMAPCQGQDQGPGRE